MAASALCGAMQASVQGNAILSKTHRRGRALVTRTTTKAFAKGTPDGDEATPATSNPTCLNRRETLSFVAAAAAAALASPAFAAATEAVTFDGVPNERWVRIPTVVNLPTSWAPRPGQRVKESKFMLYTDTYGPNYRYTTALPRYVDADGAVVANSVAVLVQSRGGQDSITDLGPQSGIDAPKAFGIEAEDISLAEEVSASKRTDGGKQTYYQWELLCPSGSHVLISACISGGGLYVLSVEANAEQWGRNGDALKGVMTSFKVPVALESTTDISDRIYNNASSGGFK